MTKFKLGDTVRVTARTSAFFDEVGRITTIDKSDTERPFRVSGLWGYPLFFKPSELILADPEPYRDMLNDPEGQQLVQAIHDRKEKP